VTIQDYLAQLDARLQTMTAIIVRSSIEREIDANQPIGLLKGRLVFLNGSVLEFSEQLPTDRRKFRFHYMDAQKRLILRWDSAPHHQELPTHPFHLHTPQGVREHPAITMMEVLEKTEAVIEL
jgi:hypothetical protein